MLNRQIVDARVPAVSGGRAAASLMFGQRAAARADAAAARGGVAFFFAAKGGGVQNKRIMLANALSARGLKVACILPEAVGPYLASRTHEVDVVDLGTRNPLKVVWRLARYLRTARPAVVIASQQHTNIAALLARLLAQSDVPIAITQHNALSELCRRTHHRSIRWLLPTLSRLLLSRAERIVAVSAGVADDLASLAGLDRHRIEVIYNPVVPPDVAERAAAPSGHPWLDAKDRPVILAAGNLIETKDFATLIRAFARVARGRQARLIVLGEGVERQRLERLADELGVADDVDLAGFIANPYAFMARADLFALSSQVEGLPSALVEALACGCPVVATDCRFGPDEILQGGRLGRLVPVGDAQAFADAILQTLEEAPDRERLRQRATQFSLEQAVERYVRLIEDLKTRSVRV